MIRNLCKTVVLFLFVFIGYQSTTINSVMASKTNKDVQKALDEMTSRPGEVKGVIIQQTKDKVTTVEQPYGKQPEVKTYTKPSKNTDD